VGETVDDSGATLMQAQTAEDRIREFILKNFPLARKNGLKLADKWLETGMLDSLGILDLVQFLEKDFSLIISDDELQPHNFESLKAVAEFVWRKSEAAK
jgi:acyl carrier protein